MNMYIGNLSFNVTEDDLKDHFSKFGTVTNVNIITNKYSRQAKVYGFVEMPDNSEADKAIKALNGIEIKGSNIKISQAEPHRKRHSRRRRY